MAAAVDNEALNGLYATEIVGLADGALLQGGEASRHEQLLALADPPEDVFMSLTYNPYTAWLT